MDAYRTGRGSIKMRAKAEIVETRRGGTAIVVTELPYQVSPRSVLTRIKELVDSRELEGIRDANDASAKGLTRVEIELKRDANANVVLNNLYKHTPLQTSFGVNMVALVDGVPRTLNLVQALSAYVGHQVEVIRRRSRVPAQQGPGSGPHRRRPDQGPRHDRRHRGRHPGVGGPPVGHRHPAGGARSASARCRPPTSWTCACPS